MAYCHSCGEPLPVAAKFCPQCGQPVPAVAEVPREETWETCEIAVEVITEKWGLFPSEMLRFVARASGARGGFQAGESAKIKAGLGGYYEPNPKNKRHVAALEELIKTLVQAGWEEIQSGPSWFQRRFRRLERS